EAATKDLVVTRDGPLRVEPPIVDQELLTKFQMGSVASAPFSGTICVGRVFLLDRANWSDDHVLLTEIVSSRIGMELDRQVLRLEAEQSVADQERIRLIRDLHDGILQSLTAAALQLRLLGDAPGEFLPRVRIVKELLDAEQRRIRKFVRGTAAEAAERLLSRDLQQVLAESARVWDCATTLSVMPQDA